MGKKKARHIGAQLRGGSFEKELVILIGTI